MSVDCESQNNRIILAPHIVAKAYYKQSKSPGNEYGKQEIFMFNNIIASFVEKL